MTLGTFLKFLALCGYPSRGTALSGGGVGLKTPGILAQSAIPATATGTGAEIVLATIQIPANTIGPNGGIDLLVLFSVASSANNKALRVRCGGQLVWSTILTSSSGFHYLISMQNRGVMNSQVSNGQNTQQAFSAGVGGVNLNTIDFSVDQTLTIGALVSTAPDTATLERYRLEVMNP